ncbi:hypothetical protein [Pseudanabaena sp. CCNP1317]|uniref:hypothetical protein n=1 Tax=Pseudanabaena sp. CCNP1317 TaxID=3110253 RepID=UPI002B21B8E3|nr:hypothetical protein [Pseudanabaena sp. CCNP1317]MEA5490298.1 hypothetical protein [Pseudanabaena sp. CCNP1317]
MKWSNNGDRTATKAQRSTSLTADLPVAPKIYDRDVLACIIHEMGKRNEIQAKTDR